MVWQFLIKLNVQLPYNPAITLLNIIYSREIKTYAYAKIYTQTSIPILFVRVKNWKQVRCLSKAEYLSNLFYIQTMEYNLAIKGINNY